jgi:hypothetical protein
MYPESEILFPRRCIQALRKLREDQWRGLVEKVLALPEDHLDSLAFSLMMIKLCKCLNCDLGSYKASLGCCTCAKRAVNSYKDPDSILLRNFEKAKREVKAYLEQQAVS